ncbi:sugar phosphate isomerase/epimerase family protein [Schlesneria sp. T3-172]|uniref:sugar phosphate isomerase/epimerase family protein n=1 Tax=Schlesneria sphaerica TaxID=3373610 RepID=UPI0037C5E236
MRLGYNTNGTTGHRWEQAIELMAEMGYRSVALTVDHYCLNPFSPDLAGEISRMRTVLDRFEMASVIETGARFLLDPRQKHEPTLVSAAPEGRAVRVNFLKRCVEIAKELNSEAVSFWGGVVRDAAAPEETMQRLAAGCRQVLDFAEPLGVKLAFEPEPGMRIQTFDDYRELLTLVDGPGFGLTVDIGHVHCLEPLPISSYLTAWRDRIYTIHIEDMCRGVHDHLRFGEGTIDFVPVMKTLKEIEYSGSVNVELSRHSHMAPEVMRESYEFLRDFFEVR